MNKSIFKIKFVVNFCWWEI